jgi:hypothetical protein
MRHDLSLIEPMAPGSQLDAKNNPIQVFHCYGSVKMIRFSYSSEDTKDKERRKGWVVDRRLNVVPSAKRRTPVPGPRHTVRQSSLLSTPGLWSCQESPYILSPRGWFTVSLLSRPHFRLPIVMLGEASRNVTQFRYLHSGTPAT